MPLTRSVFLHIHTHTYLHIIYVYYTHNIRGHTRTNAPLATPPRKKPRLQKKSKVEMEKVIESVMMYQRDADEKYQKYKEEECWQKDIELEGDKDREHDMRMKQYVSRLQLQQLQCRAV